MKENCLLVFMNAPVADKLDSLLVNTFGADRACQVYTEMAKQLFAAAKKFKSTELTVVYQADSKYHDLRWLDADDPGFLGPRGYTQEDRFVNAVKWAFDAGARKVAVLALAAQNVPQDWVEKAFAALEDKNVAFGPAQEGEVYFIGLNNLDEAFFQGYPWKGKKLYDELLERAKAQRLSVHSLPEFYLVKDEKTYQQWMGNGKIESVAVAEKVATPAARPVAVAAAQSKSKK